MKISICQRRISITRPNFSITKVEFRRQKWHLAYKYEVFNLQSCISMYKTASRLAIQHFYGIKFQKGIIFVEKVLIFHN